MSTKAFLEPDNWNSIFIVSKRDMDFDMVSTLLKMQPTVTMRQEEISIPTVEGARRVFDKRIVSDNWRRHLTGNQSRQPIERQISYWVELLYPVRAGLQHLASSGYCVVLDCTVMPSDEQIGSVQIKFDSVLLSKIAKLCVEVHFTIYTR